MDVALNKLFKDRISIFYNEWLQQENPKTPSGRLKCASLSQVAQWVDDAWYGLPTNMVCRVFPMCGISSPLLTASSSSDSSDRDSILLATTYHKRSFVCE